MAEFKRQFDVAALAKWDAAHPGNAVRALFNRWAVPGRFHRTAPLRVGVRDGYVNLYVKGQSDAKLSSHRTGPRLSLHRAYATLTPRGNILPAAGEGERDYVTHAAEALATSALADAVPDWIATALSYASAEKHFVDDLIRANVGVIDLEMALPAVDAPGAARVAPRMDLVIVQGHYKHSERLSINFWEAKMATNGELRARADYLEQDGAHRSGPKVIAQLRRYQRWMEHDDHAATVAAAYRTTGAVLADLYAAFGNRFEGEPEAVRMWRCLAACETLEGVTRPGIVIGNIVPNGYPASGSEDHLALARAAKSCSPHREKLDRHGITVREVGTSDPWADVGASLAHLPPLESGSIIA